MFIAQTGWSERNRQRPRPPGARRRRRGAPLGEDLLAVVGALRQLRPEPAVTARQHERIDLRVPCLAVHLEFEPVREQTAQHQHRLFRLRAFGRFRHDVESLGVDPTRRTGQLIVRQSVCLHDERAQRQVRHVEASRQRPHHHHRRSGLVRLDRGHFEFQVRRVPRWGRRLQAAADEDSSRARGRWGRGLGRQCRHDDEWDYRWQVSHDSLAQ
jgi:hypothetical protein